MFSDWHRRFVSSSSALSPPSLACEVLEDVREVDHRGRHRMRLSTLNFLHYSYEPETQGTAREVGGT